MSDNPFTHPALTPLMGNIPQAAGALEEKAGSRCAGPADASGDPFTGWKDLTARLLGDPDGKWKDTTAQLSAYIRENPGRTILTGIAAGLVLGVLFPDRTKPHS